MAKAIILRAMQRYGDRQRAMGLQRCDDWVGTAAAALEPESLLDVGCGDGAFLFRYLKKVPREFYGIEGSPPQKAKAEARGLKVVDCDLNGRWPFEDARFDVVFSSQVIEHLHNCRLFAEEAYRVLKPGGTALIASENLCSLLNCFAMLMGYTPFSLMQTCGRFLGNPLGLHYQEPIDQPLPIDHPAFAGVSGHIRVLTVRQARELFEQAGFKTEARSLSILPLPDGLSRVLEKLVIHKGHFLVLRATKGRE
jgi:predicted TPR repeat methyltransferase